MTGAGSAWATQPAPAKYEAFPASGAFEAKVCREPKRSSRPAIADGRDDAWQDYPEDGRQHFRLITGIWNKPWTPASPGLNEGREG